MNIKFLINEYQNIDPDEGINITFEEWDEILQNIVIKDIFTINTQRYRDFGLIDHIQLEMSENSSTFLGLWILGCYYQKKHSHYTIQLTHKNSDVKTIKMNIERDPTLNVTLESFNWLPVRIDDFKQPSYTNTNIKPYMKLSSSTKEIFNTENYSQRDLLEGFGNLSAACALAEFFLNFGHKLSKDTNYDYLKEAWSRDFLNTNSCEARIYKIDAPRMNIFDIEND